MYKFSAVVIYDFHLFQMDSFGYSNYGNAFLNRVWITC